MYVSFLLALYFLVCYFNLIVIKKVRYVRFKNQQFQRNTSQINGH